MLIWGWGRTTVKDHGPGRGFECPNCRNNVRFHLITRKKWFTLFFVPVIPYETHRLELCPICKTGRMVPKQEFEALLADMASAKAYITGSPVPPSASAPTDPSVPPVIGSDPNKA